MLKAVLFDFDGVLTVDKTGSTSIAKFLSGKTNLPADRIRAAYQKHNGGLLRGEITQAQMWKPFCAELGCDMPIQWLTEADHATPLDTEMLALVRDLRPKCRTGIITDNPAARVNEILDFFDLRGLFDAISISGEVGSRKDQPTIFERTLSALNLSAEECLFIDNTAKNLTVPGEMGFQTALFDDAQRDIAALRERLTRGGLLCSGN